jgi:hypothetical protein
MKLGSSSKQRKRNVCLTDLINLKTFEHATAVEFKLAKS